MKSGFNLKSVAIIAIAAMAFTACTKNNAQAPAAESAAAAVQTQTAVTDSSDPYAKILNGDLSEFAGAWVDGHGDSAMLISNGAFVWGLDLPPERDFTPGSRFTRDTNEAGEVYYYWGNIEENDDGESYGFGVFLYPVGTSVMMFGDLVASDKTKVRILAGRFIHEAPAAAEVFYRKGETQSRIMYVNAEDGLRIRAEPSTGSSIVRALQHGQRIVVAERSASATIDGITDYWYKISSEAGWIFGGYLSSFPMVNPALNEYKFNNVLSLFEFIVGYEKIEKQHIEDYSFLLDNKTIPNKTVSREDVRFLTVSSSNIDIVIQKYESFYEIYDIIINQNSDYMNMFPYKRIAEYLSDRSFGTIQASSNNQIIYSLSYYTTDSWTWEFGVTLNFDMNGTLHDVKIGFPR